MRPIKFRGKDKISNEWKFGSLLINRYSCMSGEKEAVFIYEFDAIGGSEFEVEPDTVGEYLGRNDKLGNEIYEGDLVKDYNGCVWEVMFFEHPYWIPFVFPCNDAPENFEIIGNKLDNPEINPENIS